MALRQSIGRRVRVTFLAWVVAFLIFFPILWTFLTSFKSELDAIAMPPKFLFFNWTLENYAEVQERSNYLKFAFNSVVLSIGANILGLIIAVPSAWAMAFAPTVVTDKKLTRRLYAVIVIALALAAAVLWLVGDARSDLRVYGPILFIAL